MLLFLICAGSRVHKHRMSMHLMSVFLVIWPIVQYKNMNDLAFNRYRKSIFKTMYEINTECCAHFNFNETLTKPMEKKKNEKKINRKLLTSADIAFYITLHGHSKYRNNIFKLMRAALNAALLSQYHRNTCRIFSQYLHDAKIGCKIFNKIYIPRKCCHLIASSGRSCPTFNLHSQRKCAHRFFPLFIYSSNWVFFSLLLASQFLFSCNANYCVFCVCVSMFVLLLLLFLFIVPNYLPMPLLGFLSNVCNHAEEMNFDKTCRKKNIYENSYTRQA